jgi:hypothetical protein
MLIFSATETCPVDVSGEELEGRIGCVCQSTIPTFFWRSKDIRRAIALMMEAVNDSETCASFYETARCNVPQDSLFIFWLGLELHALGRN